METLENKGEHNDTGGYTVSHTVTPVPALVGELVPADDSRPAALRPKQETFAQRYAAHGNAARAYREAFDCAPDIRPATVRQRAYELAHEPTVAARVRELLAEAAQGTTISARTRMVRLQEITEADPGELVRIVAESCRQCHGISHQHQWRDEMEYALALAQALDENAKLPQELWKPLPTDAGGYGFDPHRAPYDGCPVCHGYGVTRVAITPTDQLSPSARKLLKGVRAKADGTVEVQMHDQLAASDQLNKMQGVYVDRSVSINANVNVPAPKDWSHEESLAFLQSLKPAS